MGKHHKKAKSHEGDARNSHKPRVLTLRVPQRIFSELKELRRRTGRSVQSILLASLTDGPPLKLEMDVRLWLAVKSQVTNVSIDTYLDRIIYKIMKYEKQTGKDYLWKSNLSEVEKANSDRGTDLPGAKWGLPVAPEDCGEEDLAEAHEQHGAGRPDRSGIDPQ